MEKEKDLHQGANGKLFELARENRKKETRAEKKLWDELRNRKLNGLKFRRQHPLALYIADFYCHEHKLVIEIDGRQHQEAEQKEYDTQRTIELEERGIGVLRFSNEDIEYDIKGVLEMILSHLNPNPSP